MLEISVEYFARGRDELYIGYETVMIFQALFSYEYYIIKGG